MALSYRSRALRAIIKRTIGGKPRPLEEIRLGGGLAALPQAAFPRGVAFAEASLAGLSSATMTPSRRIGGRTILHLHGGGYVSGLAAAYRMLGSGLAESASAVVHVPEYRLAPEHPFPAALEDALESYRALLSTGLDPRELAVTGDSAGGGLALAAMMAIRDAGERLPAAMVLMSPWADLTVSRPASEANAESDAVLAAESLREWAAMYAAGARLADPRLSPAFGVYRGLPPMLIQVGDGEILLDDAKAVAGAAAAAGVSAELRVWEGLWHCWQMLGPLVPENESTFKEIAAFLDARLASEAAG